ncbi:TMEM1 family protein-like protein [Aaosphaeria arxii CBS 175.79]|uniref:TMEM1 family protein-like protein n=1 Tax=Aaosphaeria arxii CBS 175.79 TaxID=1450172 RepID=A0A6A5XVF4_9PLEO|nr:TMEM1 family protein-like protein [Aaosphaeria arxii CBS 175.79]KAF2016610.1 TMEM1 family protein-like protein [Aaosphaeria arxii CBS 175.79]
MSVAGNGAPGLGAVDDARKQRPIESSVMDGSSTSKVTVEYHDPSGVFPLVQEQLTARFPLRNLHWKSPNRPLRSIDSLHVDLVPSSDSVHISGVTSPGLTVPDAQGSNATTSAEIFRAPPKERRHQIPGLRRTPYLKVYLLRCDDSDSYKSTARKQLREWVKAHTPPSQSSSSKDLENHDAFEWMIIHIVVPDTPAASQPRGSASSSSTAGEKEKSRWTRGTTTILEKIRADFNVSSKSAPDRVAQIRLQKDVVPPHMLPQASAVSTPPISESPQEQDRAWTDVIVKFKTLILLSFDLRVSQYEEDIREKDSQRVLPGWNFCTFFILKEGLARGFESVGLVEDALLGYDELSVGLDAIVREQAKSGDETYGGVIPSYSEDLYAKAAEILKRSQRDDGGRKEPQSHIHDSKPLDANKKNYRDLILANNISIFDFRCYIFARQAALLLRLGNAHSSRSDLAAKVHPRPPNVRRSTDDVNMGTKSAAQSDVSEDLYSLAEVCSRALNFITFAGRLLRADLHNGAKTHDTKFPEQLVENIVRSWTYASLQQILEDTATSSLPISKMIIETGTGSSDKMQPFGGHNKEQKLSLAEPKTMIHPARKSSLNNGRSASTEPPYAASTSSAQVVYADGQYQDRPVPGQDPNAQAVKSGQQDLAGNRAQLYVVQRRILENIGKALGWTIGWAAILEDDLDSKELSDVDLDKEDSESDEDDEEDTGAVAKSKAPEVTSPTVGLAAAAIVSAVSSLENFHRYYETLSDLIVKHYMAAGQAKAGESILGDLAALRFKLGDYAAASMYFGRMASSFRETRWNLVESTMLKMHAECLKKLNRKDEYVRKLLDLLAKSAANAKSLRSSFRRTSAGPGTHSANHWLDDDKVNTTGILRELIDFSEQLPYDVTVPMLDYFSDISVEPYVKHFEDKDGFQLRVSFRHLLEDQVTVQKVRIRLVGASTEQGKEIWLESDGPFEVKKGLCHLWLSSNVNTTGPYLFDKIVLEAKRIIVTHEPLKLDEQKDSLGIIMSPSIKSLKAARKSRILCFPRSESFQARLYLSHFIHIDRQKSIEIECSSGWNDIEMAEVRLRSASAGLRLRTANATVIAGDATIEEQTKPGIIKISGLESNSKAVLQIPYDLEIVLPELSVKVEIEYKTEKGQFQYQSPFTIPIDLPLDVNVHDHFKSGSLYSKFNIKTANQVPLFIHDVKLEGSEEYEVRSPRRPDEMVKVFPRQPLAITYKVTKKEVLASQRRQSRPGNAGSLSLSVVYRCLNEDVLERARELFANDANAGQVRQIAPLLIATFVERLQHRVLPQQYEKIALLDKVDLGSFEAQDWAECIETVPPPRREDTLKWLQDWHQTNKTILLHSPAGSDPQPANVAPQSPRLPRQIIISVAIPQTHIVHTVSLTPVSAEQPSPYATTIAEVGQPFLTHLRIKHTRKWGSPESLTSLANLKSPTDPIEFVYAIEANPEIWLVAGQRRAHLTVRENEEFKTPIMLVPLKAGHTMMPNIEIRARIPPRADPKDEPEEQLNCETDYLSYGESVMIVPNVRSSTVGIGDLSSPKSTVWLESEAR